MAAEPRAEPPAVKADSVAAMAAADSVVAVVVAVAVVDAVVDADAEEAVDADVLPTKANGFLSRNSDDWSKKARSRTWRTSICSL